MFNSQVSSIPPVSRQQFGYRCWNVSRLTVVKHLV
ncbi:unnamed protein product, partial [Rotaria socialis]